MLSEPSSQLSAGQAGTLDCPSDLAGRYWKCGLLASLG